MAHHDDDKWQAIASALEHADATSLATDDERSRLAAKIMVTLIELIDAVIDGVISDEVARRVTAAAGRLIKEMNAGKPPTKGRRRHGA